MTPYKPGTLGALRLSAIRRLRDLDSPKLEVDLIMAHYSGHDRSWVHAHTTDLVDENFSRRVNEAVERRCTREPLQYILGECDFAGLKVLVEPGCLVPRPETELLVECSAQYFDGTDFLDWGTGTGCISLALLDRFPTSRGLMVEKNPLSIACARHNLEKFGFIERAEIIKSETPADIPTRPVSLVVSNPPYIPSNEIEQLMPEVSRWEPRLALDGGYEGLAPYSALFVLSARILRPGGVLCVEYGGNAQTQALRALVPQNFRELTLLRDIAGHDRVLAWKFVTTLS